VNLERQVLARIERHPVSEAALPLPSAGPALGVAEALRFNPGDDRTLDELAAAHHASSRTVERAFIADTGRTFRQWRTQTRMEAAAMLLRAPKGIDAVAHRVGYLDVSAFRRAFKAYFGVTPGEYAARHRSADTR
jgi:AraC-like DNA-binding protein